ncbi:MAG: aminoacyl-histidine dipeptidase [Clostridia bacterium]|nr:aminoacyl-histidine dipeptidase [Clostridia bacterium]
MIENVFNYFYEFSKIPHGSGNTKQISDYLVKFAKDRNLEHYQDEVNNVIIIKEAGKGYENAPAVIIQGHMDMVCAKEPDCTKDMTKEGIDIETDGEYLFAKGTTLGGDDGIAVAYALALLDDTKNNYPRLEVVITVDEEIGLLGANHIDLSMLKGKIMLNIDSESEGVFTAGCAGGLRIDSWLDISRENVNKKAFKISLKGLKGGHSGVDINKNRGNANKIMGEILELLPDILIVSINGGSADNVIPSICNAVIKADSIDFSIIEKIKEKYNQSEPDLEIIIEEADCDNQAMDLKSTQKIIAVINKMPNGIQEMHKDIDGLVKTSLNMGIISTEQDKFHIATSVRSSSDEEKYALTEKVKAITESYGEKAETRGDYCGWDYKKDSSLRELMCDVFKKQYGKEPVIDIIHAGLECGIISSKIEGLDCISFGPDLFDIHTPKERLDIKSAQRVWNFIKAVLKEIK